MAANNDRKAVPNRIFLLSMPRSASNLLETMLSAQPGYDISGYYMFEVATRLVMNVGKGPLESVPREQLATVHQNMQASFERMLDKLRETEDMNRRSIVKEHVVMLLDPIEVYRQIYPLDRGPSMAVKTPGSSEPEGRTTNLCLPDSFLLTIQPILQIRHPALMFPSLVRAMRRAIGPNGDLGALATMTLAWTRQLYDWFLSHGIQPYVIDGDDVMNDPGRLRNLCKVTGMDSDAIKWEWDVRTTEDRRKMAFASTIYNSTGIVAGKDSKGLQIDREVAQWSEEFGSEMAEKVKAKVEAAMPIYEGLLQHRVPSDTPL